MRRWRFDGKSWRPTRTVPGGAFGEGLFETLRVTGGRPVAWERHLGRLVSSAPLLGLAPPLPPSELREAFALLLPGNLWEGFCRVILSREDAGATLWLEFGPPRPAVTAYKAVKAPFPRSERSPLSRVKSLNQLENILARRAARAVGADEAIFLNTAGRLAEGSFTNLFLLRGDLLRTPPPEEGLLPGITREMLLEVARELGFTVRVEPLGPGDLAEAEEMCLSSSLRGLRPVTSFGRWQSRGSSATLALAAALARQEALETR